MKALRPKNVRTSWSRLFWMKRRLIQAPRPWCFAGHRNESTRPWRRPWQTTTGTGCQAIPTGRDRAWGLHCFIGWKSVLFFWAFLKRFFFSNTRKFIFRWFWQNAICFWMTKSIKQNYTVYMYVVPFRWFTKSRFSFVAHLDPKEERSLTPEGQAVKAWCSIEQWWNHRVLMDVWHLL